MRRLFVVAMLLAAASAYAGDQQDQPNGRPGEGRGGPPGVYDAQGKFVGQLETNSGGDGVFLTINGALTFVAIERVPVGTQLSATQFEWASARYIYYPSTDCSGLPVLENVPPQAYMYGPRPSEALRLGTDVVLYVASGANSITVQAWSAREPPNLTCIPYSAAQVQQQVFVPDTTYPLTQTYPEPLSVRY